MLLNRGVYRATRLGIITSGSRFPQLEFLGETGFSGPRGRNRRSRTQKRSGLAATFVELRRGLGGTVESLSDEEQRSSPEGSARAFRPRTRGRVCASSGGVPGRAREPCTGERRTPNFKRNERGRSARKRSAPTVSQAVERTLRTRGRPNQSCRSRRSAAWLPTPRDDGHPWRGCRRRSRRGGRDPGWTR